MAAARRWLMLGLVSCLFGLAVMPATAGRDDEEYDAQLEARIRGAVQRGVNYLRGTQTEDGWWEHQKGNVDNRPSNVGATALCGLALLFAKVDVSDPAVQNAAAQVRAHAGDLRYTYSIALALVFLDRINQGRDNALIKLLGERLLAGQLRQSGGWTYYCPGENGIGDNSNTQLAMLALFVARKYGLNVQAALKAAEARFRTSQQGGAWGYQPGFGSPLNRASPAMTCAGLLALAFNFVVQRAAVLEGAPTDIDALEPSKIEILTKLQDPRSDPQVRAALNFLADNMKLNQSGGEHFVYFLWTLERTCLVYDWKKIQGIDWYYWGARLLLPLQKADGGWDRDHISGRNCETAWALLFLCKADILGSLFDFAVLTGGSFKQAGPKRGAAPPRARQPKAEPGREGKPGEAAALTEELRTAAGDRIEEIIDLLEKTRGGEYTNALVATLGSATGDVKRMLQDALTRRLSRMNEKTLRTYLDHQNAVCRRAAALAVALKNDKETSRELTPQLIFMLRDSSPEVKEAAYQALKKITGKDQGTHPDSWDRWWRDQIR